MKTSFYFVIWILIYPILGLFNNSFIDNNSFIVALAIVWGLSWLLNRMMPETLSYESVLQMSPILEDVYTGNVASFRKRLAREANIETVTAIYFAVTTAVIAIVIFKSGFNDWIALIIFSFFTYGAISRSISLIRAKASLKSDPTAEQCMEIANETYNLDYASYYDMRIGSTYRDLLLPVPKHFKAFNIFSLVIAIIAALLGLLNIILAVIIMLSQNSIEAGTIAVMYFLYGSLAVYFGVKDFISCIYTKSSTKNISNEQTA